MLDDTCESAGVFDSPPQVPRVAGVSASFTIVMVPRSELEEVATLGAHALDALCQCCVRLNPQHGDGYADRTCRCTDTESFRERIAPFLERAL